MASHPNLHDQDFYAWALENAALLRDGRLSEIDIEHVAEELESMGRSERRELVSRLAILFAHLLKWANQSGRRSTQTIWGVSERVGCGEERTASIET